MTWSGVVGCDIYTMRPLHSSSGPWPSLLYSQVLLSHQKEFGDITREVMAVFMHTYMVFKPLGMLCLCSEVRIKKFDTILQLCGRALAEETIMGFISSAP